MADLAPVLDHSSARPRAKVRPDLMSTSPTSAAPGPQRARVDTRFLLFLAVVFVVNSHLEAYYPRPYFAGDGLIGYSLFFFVSGLGLALSAKRGTRPFLQYYYRRILRIYPTVWFVAIPEAIVTGAILTFSARDFVSSFVWPTHNTFVAPIMIDYALLYLALRPRSARFVAGTMAVLAVPAVVLWIKVGHLGSGIYEDPLGIYLATIAYFEAMLLGAYFGLSLPGRLGTFRRDAALFVATLLAYIALKYSLIGGHHKNLYPTLYLLTFAMLYWLLRMACSTGLEGLLGRLRPVAFVVNLLGVCSLEAYFVHTLVVVHWKGFATALPCPLNLIALWSLVIPGSYLLERLASWARTGFRKFSWRLDSSAAA
jgi:peptidoglycan/LPS O-acetylase OafA/YrhL